MTCIGVSPKRPQNQYIHWQASYIYTQGISSSSGTPKGRSLQIPAPVEANSALWVSPHTVPHIPWSGSTLTVSQPKGHLCTRMDQQQSRFNYSRRVHITHTRDIPRAPNSYDQGDCAIEPHTYYIRPSFQDWERAVQPNTQK